MKEIRVYSMAVLDLLTCALGSTVLVSFLLIVSMGRPSGAGFPYAYFVVSGGVWIDVTDEAEKLKGVVPGILSDPGVEVDDTQAERLRSLSQECEVELQIYWKPSVDGKGAEVWVPRASHDELLADSLFKINSSSEGVQLRDKQQGAKFIGRTTRLGLRRVKVGQATRIYAAFLVHGAGFQVDHGWYFAGLSILKYPNVNDPDKDFAPHNAAWLRIDSGGDPGAIFLQTDRTFDDPEWPGRLGYPRLLEDWSPEAFPAEALSQPRSARSEMTRRGVPDLYVPDWPVGFPSPDAFDPNARPSDASPSGPRFQYCPGLGVSPYFAIHRERAPDQPNQGVPFPARIPSPDAPQGPGWHHVELKDGLPSEDDFLPGFRIGSEGHP